MKFRLIAFAAPVIAAAISLPTLVSDEVLEPSVQNEVDHALAKAPAAAWAEVTNEVECAAFATNGLSRTAIALKLVSTQRADGRWLDGTNDVTVSALRILRSL